VIDAEDVKNMMLACQVASFSIESTKVGCIVPYEGVTYSGCNIVKDGFLYHAEDIALRTALLHTKKKMLKGATVYVTKTPCFDCCYLLSQYKVGRLVAPRPYTHHPYTHEKSGWYENQMNGIELLKHNVTVDYLDTTLGTVSPTVHPSIMNAFGIDKEVILPS
jgi:tRNA(Arg) A34 adenosine deaminase TadA